MSEESTDSSEQERKRRKKEKKKEEKKRKKEKKKAEKRKKKEAAGERGVTEEEAATDMEEVKAEIEDMAVEGDAGGGGGLVVTPWLRGEAGHAWGMKPRQPTQRDDLPWAQGALDMGYSPDAHLFSSPEVTYVTLRWAFHRLSRHRIRNKGEGGVGGWRYTGGGGGGGMGMEAPTAKAPAPHLRTNRGWGFDAVQSFFGAARGPDAGLPLGADVPPLRGKRGG